MKRTKPYMILVCLSLLSYLFGSFLYYSESTFSIVNAYGSVVIENDNDMSSAQDTSSSEIGFGNVTNLTDNPNDSAYGQVAASDNNVYVVWEDSTTPELSNNNYDIYFKKSADGGESFAGYTNSSATDTATEVLNLSNNPGFSNHPQIAAYDEKVHVAWIDDSLGNNEILFARSTDNGTTFSNATNLSNTITNSRNLEIAAFENNVYAVWLDEDGQGNGIILFAASNDGGGTFSNPVTIARDVDNNNNDITLPKVAAYGDNVHVAWNEADNTQVAGETLTDLLYVKSSDQGNTFSAPMKLNNNGEKVGEAQLTAYENAVYVVWGSSPYDQITSNLFFTKSIDNGNTFSSATEVKSETFVNPSNVEIMVIENDGQENASQSPSTSPLAPQSSLSSSRQQQQQQQQQQPPYLYITGQVPVSNQNEDIFLVFSNDDGQTFSEITTNLSKNMDISECPSIATAGNNVYVIWQDRTSGNNEVLFTKGET